MTTATFAIDFEKIKELLRPQGLFASYIRSFEARPQQLEMLRDVINAYNDNKIALIEAGTGTGKSLAYLLPAIIWAYHAKERTVISTHTITLQEQLLKKDIPMITQALGLDIKTVLVKGMSNYLCLRKLEETKYEKLLYPLEEQEELARIEAWSETTRDGTKSTLPILPSVNTWEHVCAEKDTCTNKRCPYYNKCFFFNARKEAESAQILVVNHHLLFANLSADYILLPNFKRIILDEAHHIEDVATEYFASKANEIHCLRIIGRLQAEKGLKAYGKIPLLKEKILEYYGSRALPTPIQTLIQRISLDLPTLRYDLLKSIVDTFETFNQFAAYFVKDEDLENKLRLRKEHETHLLWRETIIPQVENFVQITQKYIQVLESIENDLKLADDDNLNQRLQGTLFEINALSTRLAQTCLMLTNFVGTEISIHSVRWIENQQLKKKNNTHLIDAQLDVSKYLADSLFNPFPTIVLCSATLTTNKSFDFIRQRIGLEHLENKCITESMYESPFDYQQQSLLVIPNDLPPPTDSEFLPAAIEAIWQAIKASNGNAFVLFTSYSMMKQCHAQLSERMAEHRFTSLKQGDMNRQSLLQQFKTTNRSVLFGTDSFWEGVDVVGEALRCVIIVKLPFKVPSEPIIEARAEAIEAEGGNAFWEYSLPSAIVKFKQGFGRLIRNKKDRGCVVCLDIRLLSRSYGKLFLRSLPPSKQIIANSNTVWEEMREFYRKTHYLTRNN